jgi:hypothetical protein
MNKDQMIYTFKMGAMYLTYQAFHYYVTGHAAGGSNLGILFDHITQRHVAPTTGSGAGQLIRFRVEAPTPFPRIDPSLFEPRVGGGSLGGTPGGADQPFSGSINGGGSSEPENVGVNTKSNLKEKITLA